MTQSNRAAANTMSSEEFNRRFNDLVQSYENLTPQDAASEKYALPIAQEAYLLSFELPPASDRYQRLRRMMKDLAVKPEDLSVHPATSAQARKVANRDPKLPPEHHATRGRTVFKATPKQLAAGKVKALEAQAGAYAESIIEREREVEVLKADRERVLVKLVAARAALKQFNGGRKAAEPTKAEPTPKAAAPKKTPGALSPGMRKELKAVAAGKMSNEAVARVMRMHLVMRGCLEKGTMKLTAVGRKELKS